VLTDRRESGFALHRYDDSRATDYLSAWLTHLAAAASSPTPIVTQWISRDGDFRFRDARDARSILAGILTLYRRGLREPLHFFPKSAWEYIKTQRNLSKALEVWQKAYGSGRGRGEHTHAAYKLALRGIQQPLNADFQDAAETVFGSAQNHLDDARLNP
jgi:exodeoxyribonuclease V gamma subunit